MNLTDVRKLYAYTDWANDRILGVTAALSEEQFTRRIVSSFSSMRDTLSHIAFAEWLWLRRWMGESPLKPPAWTNAPSFAILEGRMHEIAADRRPYLADLRDDAIDSTLEYTSTQGDRFTMPLSSLLIHCANHSTYHRGQLVTMLRQAGVAPPNTDYTQFVRS
jgi:uncharacterized damage-inducible protein DinB